VNISKFNLSFKINYILVTLQWIIKQSLGKTFLQTTYVINMRSTTNSEIEKQLCSINPFHLTCDLVSVYTVKLFALLQCNLSIDIKSSSYYRVFWLSLYII